MMAGVAGRYASALLETASEQGQLAAIEADIDKLGTAGVTRGCNPPLNNQFCPDSFVTREQMAAFLRRALS